MSKRPESKKLQESAAAAKPQNTVIRPMATKAVAKPATKAVSKPVSTSTPAPEVQERYHGLGSHLETRDGVAGARFAVWAPNATEVCVLTDGNGWQHGNDWLQGSDSGVWTGFIPGATVGTRYKYSLRTKEGNLLDKADPYAFSAELPPATASIIHDLDEYEWKDDDWMHRRGQVNWMKQPVSVYEVQLASWKRPWDGRRYHSYRELAHMLVDYVRELGYTHIELMPVTEYPFDGSWGYQVTGYFAPTSRFGGPDEFRYFVDYCHQNNIGVIIDWVPAHFPYDDHGLARFDGTGLYEHSDPKQGFHPDWNTHIFNYGRHEVREFLHSSARFWLKEYHIDGLRVDAVASMLYLDYSREDGEWIPNQFGGNENLEAIEFLKQFNTHLHADFPGAMTIAEESTSFGGVSRPVYDGGLGFGYKWDMGWMHDTLEYLGRETIYRKYHQDELAFRSVYQFTENFMLPLSHDEVVHGKGSLLSRMPGDQWQRFANLRLLYGYQYACPGKKLLFMGCEFGQSSEWNADSQLDWSLLQFDVHDGVKKFIGDLNRVYKDYSALHELDCEPEGFSWIAADDADKSIFTFCRLDSSGQHVVVVLNFTPSPHSGYRIGVPAGGDYIEILNSDSELYGGSNVGNLGGQTAEKIKSHGRDFSMKLNLPPLGCIMLAAKTKAKT
ncbi:1,4-alpha-glucan branching enzyme [Neorhodopirellula lusitana]|uniref:1,4-alpha-glucan branching enzyme GlgB n=1 Tax=Neorhodopirellula lusitana TaxID=445327 RepID=A0ABY1PNB3_9BACT|nr:1,4-alpha-glucan branching protein GlgB [Neorhodopirellula lusitana]SMP38984.1 1,4-alpha-glucan branching enzyme [Neorhodopirellula lusitana]